MIEDFQSYGDGHPRFYATTGGSIHLRSEIMQKLKVSTGIGNVSTGTQSCKVVKGAEDGEYRYWICEYRYSKLLKAQWMWSIGTKK